ncbi:MAG TPA: DUF58 domain-containing protein [Solirubrobacteraceae bacterium]|jgi:uncharacterized protein (DUF58 family)|nr:DUF58 domain-containing protein [Solirubrobacteraceae bacterium]
MSAARAGAVAACGCVLGVVALVFDAAPLFVPAVGLLALGLLAPAWVWLAASGASAQRRLTVERVIENEPLDATIHVRRGRLGLGGWGSFEVIDPLTGSRFELRDSLSPLRGDRTADLRAVTRFAERGQHRLPEPSLTLSDPLDLARAQSRAAGEGHEVLVLPATEPVRWLIADQGHRLKLPEGHDGSEALAAVDIDGLRPYRPGTPASRIHWPAVARGAGLIERRLQADGDSRPLVVLDARLPSAPGASELLDAAVRAVASLVLELARRGGCGLLLPGERRATKIDRELIAWPAAYARLAVVEAPAGARAARGPALGSTASRTGAMIYVAAAPVERLTSRLGAAGAGPTLLVVPDRGLSGGRPAGVRGPMRAAFAVSGCHGFVLGVGRATRRASERTVA